METSMIKGVRRVVPALLVALTACTAPAANRPVVTEIPSGAVDVAWSDAGAVRLAHAYNSGFGSAVRTIVGDAATWQVAWTTYTKAMGSPPPAPAVDFDRYEVIVAALGQRNTGGYDITVSRIASTNDYLYVELTSLRPGPRCFTTQALTQPVDMVRIPRQHPPVVFVEKSVQSDC
jgi:hypothetical protein